MKHLSHFAILFAVAGLGIEPAGAGPVAPNIPRFIYLGVPPAFESGKAVWRRPAADSTAADPATSRIIFQAAATSVVVRLNYPRPERRHSMPNGAVRVDGELSAGFTRPGPKSGLVRVELSFPERKRRAFDVILPAAETVEFLGLDLPDGEDVDRPPAPPRLRFAAMGDSITHGFFATHPLFTWPARVGEALKMDWINLGYNGRGVVPADADGLPALKPDAVLVLLGVNECQRGTKLEVFEASYAEFLRRVLRANPKLGVWAITPLPCGSLGGRWRVEQIETYREAIRKTVKAMNDPRVRLVEGPALLPVPDPAALRAFTTDALHPNDAGFAVLASNLVARLKADGVPAP
jgi:lysophospholipase L1-like esterase